MSENTKTNLIVSLVMGPIIIAILLYIIPCIIQAVEVDKTCTAIPKGFGEYDFVPNYFMDGQENVQLNKLKNDLCNKYFKDSSRTWYVHDMDGSKIQIKLCDNMEKESQYYNGIDCGGGKYIAINNQIYADRNYNSKEELEKGGNKEITSVVLHELIHSYVAFYYPDRANSNVNHKGIFEKIEKDLISQGCYLNQNYIRSQRDAKRIKKEYAASKKKKR